jgi:phospholipid/cholesterol/gamma-HCH transport system substrate-binding protein
MTRGSRVVAALAVVVALIGIAVAAVRGAYGAFKGGYTVSATFERAAYGFGPDTEVDYLGVDVGHVTHIRLTPAHQVQAMIKINEGFQVPVGTSGDVEERSLFGDPYIDLVFPAGNPTRFLANGGRIEQTSVEADTTDLIAHATPLLQQVNGQDLLTLVTELDQATQGEGPKIAQSIQDGVQLTNLYADTITAQLKALDAFTAFQTALQPDASTLNTLGAETNNALPTLNAAEANFQAALESVQPFAQHLAAVISAERPNIDQLLTRGDNVVRLLAMREPQVEQVVAGLALYLQKFAQGGSPETLPNGTKFIYFKNFIEFSDIQKLICGLVAPPAGSPLPAQFQPVVAALSNTALGCGSAAGTTAGAASGGTAQSAASDLLNQIASQIAAPEPPQASTGTVGNIIDSLLGTP